VNELAIRTDSLPAETPTNRIVVIEFPSHEHAKAWYASADYRVAMAIRQSASTGTLILVEGVEPASAP